MHGVGARVAGFTLVEALLAAALALSAIGLLGMFGPFTAMAGASAQRQGAVWAAENLRAVWSEGRPPESRRIALAEWLHLAPDDPRLWWANGEGWGPWAEARRDVRESEASGREPAPERGGVPQEAFVAYELALLQSTAQSEVRAVSPRGWLVVSWPVYDAHGRWVERSRRGRWSLAVAMVSP